MLFQGLIINILFLPVYSECLRKTLRKGINNLLLFLIGGITIFCQALFVISQIFILCKLAERRLYIANVRADVINILFLYDSFQCFNKLLPG